MRRLCATVLIFEAIVIGLAIPVAITIEHEPHAAWRGWRGAGGCRGAAGGGGGSSRGSGGRWPRAACCRWR